MEQQTQVCKGFDMRSQSDCCSYYPPQRLELRKTGGNSGWKERENMKREGSLSQMPHPRLALSGGQLFNFQAACLGSLWSNFSHSLLMSVVTVGPVWLT